MGFKHGIILSSMIKITKAIIPVAGLGTRFLPATKAMPKEMLPVVDKPVIQYIVEEAVAAGIKEIIFVTALGKRAIEDHFDRNFELEYRLEEKKKKKELAAIAAIGQLAKFAFVRQAKPLGDGHAILSALPFIDKHEPVAVLFGDDIIESRRPAIGQLMEVYKKHNSPVVAIMRVQPEAVGSYGIIGGKKLSSRVWQIKKFVEKPKPAEAPSRLAVVGHYIITPAIYDLLITQQPGSDGEIRLADAFISYLKGGKSLYGCRFEGVRYDCGNKLEFIKAQIAFGLKHPDLKQELRTYLRKQKI